MNRFTGLVRAGMEEAGVTLRELCRQADLDPSYLSKVLSGKRSPPAEEKALRRLAKVLGLDPAELTVAAGRIPGEWKRLHRDPGLFRAVHRMLTGPAPVRPVVRAESDDRFAEELL